MKQLTNLQRLITKQVIRQLHDYTYRICYRFKSSILSYDIDDLIQICNIQIMNIVANGKYITREDIIKISKVAIYNKLKDIYKYEKIRPKNVELLDNRSYSIEYTTILTTDLKNTLNCLTEDEKKLLLVLIETQIEKTTLNTYSKQLNISVPTLSKLISNLRKKFQQGIYS
jgi:RNA polymerase sigma factor (sigma-70 family)